jgi:hypothetical protein
LFHNGALSDPLNEYSKASKKISSKKAKTDADYEKLQEIEFYGGLYLNKDGKVVVPGLAFEACLGSGAAKLRLKKVVAGALFVEEDALLVFDGPQDLKERSQDPSSKLTVGVKIQKSRIQRTRPMFNKWHFHCTINYDDSLLNKEQVKDILKEAGQQGLCDWRPRYGRFTVSY